MEIVDGMDGRREPTTVLDSSTYQSVISDRNRLNVQRIDDDDTMDSTSSGLSAVDASHRSEAAFFRGFTRRDIVREVRVSRGSSENDVR